MSNKKYQVFISSTYSDLIEERRKAIDAVLMTNCMPAGMEAFSASDEKQFDVIKRVIDLCDYYVLIIANRYGSIFPGKEISYTEMEFEYAQSKGIPVLAFIIDPSVKVDNDKTDNDELLSAKLTLFKKRVSSNRLVSYWKTKDELFGNIISALYNAITQFIRPGWIRGGEFDEQRLLSENHKLSEKIQELELQLSNTGVNNNKYENIIFPMHYSETIIFLTSGMKIDSKDIHPTLGELFKHISNSLTSKCSYFDFCSSVNSFVPGYHTSDTAIKQLKTQFLIFGLITEHTEIINKKNELFIELTEYGLSELKRLNRI